MNDGELVFWSINVPEVPLGKRFFAKLFGWQYSAPGVSGAVLIEGRKAAFHPSGYQDPQEFSVCVNDIDAAVASARAAGGTATDPRTTLYGASSALRDPNGVRLALSWNRSGHQRLVEPRGAGALCGWNLRSSDPAGSARFFADLFGWHTAPPPGCTPGAALRVLGHAIECSLVLGTADTLPSPGHFVFEVDDVVAAVGLVRSAGGTAGPTLDSSRGRWVTAADDQHTAFTLCQRTG